MSDLEAQLAIARDDMRTLADAYRHAWSLDEGYGVGSPGVGSRVTGSPRAPSPTGDTPPIAAAVSRSLHHLAWCHHWYGEVGQTVWPVTALCRTCTLDHVCDRHRPVTLTEALEGVVTADLVLAELQRNLPVVGEQEAGVVERVATHACSALGVLPESLWRAWDGTPVTPDLHQCTGVADMGCGRWIPWEEARCERCGERAKFAADPKGYLSSAPVCVECGRDVQDRGSRCWACRQARHRASV